jgi:hypothetical protein
MGIRRAYSAVIGRWRRRSMDPKHVLLRRVKTVAVSYVVGSIVVGRLTWGSHGPGLVTPFAFAALFLAAAALMGIAIIHSQDLVDEMEASNPPELRRRGRFVRVMNPMLSTANAKFRRASREWRARVGRAFRRAASREGLVRSTRALARALSGVPPAGTSPRNAGRLGRPIAVRQAERSAPDAAPERWTRPPLQVRRAVRASQARSHQRRRPETGVSAAERTSRRARRRRRPGPAQVTGPN